MLSFTTDQIKEIAEQLDCGFRAYYHKQSGELVFVPNMDRHDGMDKSAWKEEFARLRKRSAFQEVAAMEARDSFAVMQDFAEQLTDEYLQERLYNALNRKHPFREFNFVIDNSGEHRNAWFEFKDKRYLEWVNNQINLHNSL